MVKTVQKIWSSFLDIIFPSLCVNCLRRGEKTLCSECFAKIEINNSFFCPECNRRLPADEELLKTKNLCHPEARFILAAAAPYENKVVRELIHALKYNRTKAVLEPLGEIINQYVRKVIGNSGLETRDFVAVPIPLHPRKERERGFNQATLIAEMLPQRRTGNLVRIKNTKSQTNLRDGEERQRNVSGVFVVEKPEEVAGQNIILIDDVFTSGATMKEAVRVLKAAGAKKIIGFVIAKT